MRRNFSLGAMKKKKTLFFFNRYLVTAVVMRVSLQGGGGIYKRGRPWRVNPKLKFPLIGKVLCQQANTMRGIEREEGRSCLIFLDKGREEGRSSLIFLDKGRQLV